MKPASWRTSLAGMLAGVLGTISHTPGLPPWLAAVLGGLGAIAGGVGLYLARDNSVSDEQAGAGQVVR